MFTFPAAACNPRELLPLLRDPPWSGMQGPATSQACHHCHLKSGQICLLKYPRPQEIFLPALSSFSNIISQMKAWMGQCSRSFAAYLLFQEI